ncbi:hypothetical protein LTS10_006095 [Elasticomyces elasticus]|nr:hypothetical protein LTS10_006095 [Elasticomyces elasticus]
MPSIRSSKRTNRVRAERAKKERRHRRALRKLEDNSRTLYWKRSTNSVSNGTSAEEWENRENMDAEADEVYAMICEECEGIDPEKPLSQPFDDEYEKRVYDRRIATRAEKMLSRESRKDAEESLASFEAGWRKHGEDAGLGLGDLTLGEVEKTENVKSSSGVAFGTEERSMRWE